MKDGMKTYEVLERAADAIDKYGWRIGLRGYLRANGEPTPMCLYGSLAFVECGDPARDISLRALNAVARELPANANGSLIRFNDSPARKQDDVTTLLRDAARAEWVKEHDGLRSETP